MLIFRSLKEVILDIQYTIIKNSKEKSNFTSDIIENFKKINTLQLTSKEFLEITVQEFIRTQEYLWYKHVKQVNIVRHSKEW